jgi:hypothetical protein
VSLRMGRNATRRSSKEGFLSGCRLAVTEAVVCAELLVRFEWDSSSGLPRAPGMPIELQFTGDGLGVIYQCEGSLGLQHFADANSRLLASPDRIKRLKYAIVDGASVEPQLLGYADGRNHFAGPAHRLLRCRGIAGCVGRGTKHGFGTRSNVGSRCGRNRVGNEDFPVTGGSRNLDTHPRESQVRAGYFAVHGERIISAARSPCSLDRFSAYSVRWPIPPSIRRETACPHLPG